MRARPINADYVLWSLLKMNNNSKILQYIFTSSLNIIEYESNKPSASACEKGAFTSNMQEFYQLEITCNIYRQKDRQTVRQIDIMRYRNIRYYRNDNNNIFWKISNEILFWSTEYQQKKTVLIKVN